MGTAFDLYSAHHIHTVVITVVWVMRGARVILESTKAYCMEEIERTDRGEDRLFHCYCQCFRWIPRNFIRDWICVGSIVPRIPTTHGNTWIVHPWSE